MAGEGQEPSHDLHRGQGKGRYFSDTFMKVSTFPEGMWVCVCSYVCLYIYVCMYYVCMYICTYVTLYVLDCDCVYAYIYIYIYIM